MLYIKKTQPSPDLWHFIKTERDNGNIHPKYDEIPSTPVNIKQQLRQQLYDEQRGICCYCMQVLEKPDNHTNIEHFLPDSLFAENRVDYYNLYLACQHSKGKAAKDSYCDIAKKDNLIPKFIGYHKCEDLIQYDYMGYILPAHPELVNFSEFGKEKHFQKLDGTQKEILGMIDILNLNHTELVAQRKKIIGDYLNLISSINDIQKIESMLTDAYQKIKLKFAGVAIYLLKKRLEIVKRRKNDM